MSAVYYVDLRYHKGPNAGDEIPYSWLDANKPSGPCVRLETIDEACGSDYSGGSHTRSNYDVITGDPELAPHVIRLYGGYGSYGVAYVGDLEDQPEALRDAVAALADYPILDDDAHSEHELQLETEAWNDYGCTDFKRALTDYLDENDDAWLHDMDRLTDNEVWSVWRDGVETFNVNGGSGYTIETGESVHFYIKEWFRYNRHTPNDLTELGLSSYCDSLTLDEIIAKTRCECVPGRDDELDTVVEVMLVCLGRLLVTLCGFDPDKPHEAATIRFTESWD